MFLHHLKYDILSGLRSKEFLIWLLLFPIILGVFFKTAFGGIYDSDIKFSSIKTAIVETEENAVLHQVISSMSEAEHPLLDAEFTDEEKAMEMLRSGDVNGVIFAGEKLTLTVSERDIPETILTSFVEQYNIRQQIITEAVQRSPQNYEAVISALSDEVNSCREIPLTEGNTDYMIQYFYNLIAMVALYGSMTGLHIAITNQGNLSALGARKCCSPAPKSIAITASIVSSILLQTLCMVVCVTFLHFCLKVDFGSQLPLVYAASIMGGILGVCLGFFIGSIGNLSEGVKTGLALAVSMISCFLSGLMIGDMKPIVAKKAPWFNDINPAAVISDSLYCLNIYSDHKRFLVKITTMLVMSLIFAVLGFILTRRKKYADL